MSATSRRCAVVIAAMHLTVLPDATEVRATGLPPGALAAFALGFANGETALPGGAALEIVPIAMSPSAMADEHGVVFMRVPHTAGGSAGLEFLAQVVYHVPGVPLEQAGSLRVLPVMRGRVPSPGDPADLVIFFGQSNCEGWAGVADLRPELRGPHPRLRIWNGPAGQWQPVEAGVNTNMAPNAPFFGAEIGMADSLGNRAAPLFLIKQARSPSTLGPNPGPGNEWGVHAGELYASLLQRITNATGVLQRQGYQPRVKLICMMQGESDAAVMELADGYLPRLEELLTRLRLELRDQGLSGAEPPWIRLGLVNRELVRIGLLGTPVVRAAQTTVAGTLARCDVLETTGLGVMPDRLHFASDGLLQMGRRFVARRL